MTDSRVYASPKLDITRRPGDTDGRAKSWSIPESWILTSTVAAIATQAALSRLSRSSTGQESTHPRTSVADSLSSRAHPRYNFSWSLLRDNANGRISIFQHDNLPDLELGQNRRRISQISTISPVPDRYSPGGTEWDSAWLDSLASEYGVLPNQPTTNSIETRSSSSACFSQVEASLEPLSYPAPSNNVCELVPNLERCHSRSDPLEEINNAMADPSGWSFSNSNVQVGFSTFSSLISEGSGSESSSSRVNSFNQYIIANADYQMTGEPGGPWHHEAGSSLAGESFDNAAIIPFSEQRSPFTKDEVSSASVIEDDVQITAALYGRPSVSAKRLRDSPIQLRRMAKMKMLQGRVMYRNWKLQLDDSSRPHARRRLRKRKLNPFVANDTSKCSKRAGTRRETESCARSRSCEEMARRETPGDAKLATCPAREGSPHLYGLASGTKASEAQAKLYSRVWLIGCLVIPVLGLCYGHGYFDGLMRWHTNGAILHFRQQEKTIVLVYSYCFIAIALTLLFVGPLVLAR